MKKSFEIIFEDDDLVVVNKAPFVLTIPDRYEPDKLNLLTWLTDHFGKIFVVHRLDKETSGLLVFAKNEQTHHSLSQQFEGRTVKKIYKALVSGVIHADEGVIEKPLAPHPTHPEKIVVTETGKPSMSEFTVVERFKNYSLLDVSIKTGRTHQIRVHLQSIGYPLAVDEMYGKKNAFLLSEVKGSKYKSGKYAVEERPLMSRCSLHAFRLSFRHPSSGELVSFEAGLPKDFSAALQQLRKWGK
jgi:23S rRNA pseudouridine955/2504/2580 synthase/23S rRNA pseudouridine1911/1915/1917 synthase